jgi:hypothetical protein
VIYGLSGCDQKTHTQSSDDYLRSERKRILGDFDTHICIILLVDCHVLRKTVMFKKIKFAFLCLYCLCKSVCRSLVVSIYGCLSVSPAHTLSVYLCLSKSLSSHLAVSLSWSSSISSTPKEKKKNSRPALSFRHLSGN